MKNLEIAILRTLCYADIFDYPLTETELWQFLVNNTNSLEKFRSALTTLLNQDLIRTRYKYYMLPRRRHLTATRKSRSQFAQKKNLKAQRYARLLAHIPTVWFVGVSGALAMNNTPKSDDIDIFIITAPHTLWLTRFLVTVLFDILGVRRKPKDVTTNDKFCLNMFLDSSQLTLPKNMRDLYTAHEIVQLKPLINKYFVYECFLQANRWVHLFLPHSQVFLKHLFPPLPNWSLFIPKIINISCEVMQRWYMRNHQTNEVVTKTLVRFHPSDARHWVLNAYKERCRIYALLTKTTVLK